MKLNSDHANLFIPDGSESEQALSRTTHLGIGAHADDLEVLAYPGIVQCYQDPQQWFTGVVITDGAGSPRSGNYADYSNEEMISLRMQEQREAAALGKYSAQLQLGYTSDALRGDEGAAVTSDLLSILSACQPRVVYVHNLADSHHTHVAASLASLEAIRQLPRPQRPTELYAVEIWRSLDWLPSRYRVELEIDPDSPLQGNLLRVFDSQIAGGKRYDLAVLGRQAANATFSHADTVDQYRASILAKSRRKQALSDKPANE